jgi:Outer membrane protein beta-barrel domain
MICMILISRAQIGVKAGLNFANITKASSINSSSRSGFHAGLFLAPPSQSVMGYRTELIFSRQGFNYGTGTSSGQVNLDYVTLPQYMTISITKYFQIQLGGQMSFLVNAKADSSNDAGSGSSSFGKVMNYYNKFDYGYGGGIEIHPVGGLLIGARVCISLSSLYKSYSYTSPGETPSFVPTIDVKNNLFQVFAGWKFGQTGDKKKKKEPEQ